MAFMVPIVKKDYNIYSCSRTGLGTPGSSSRSGTSSLSSSPSAASSFVGSPRNSHTPQIPKSGSQASFTNFHGKVLDKLRKTFKGKDGSADDVRRSSGSSTFVIR